ncbi:MAG: hypothetical protein JSV36_06255 [Anaerolineae bacterium]|nr:MAG: hypothetical protein JSV36_06255 [Anaerolineae bacterium]
MKRSWAVGLVVLLMMLLGVGLFGCGGRGLLYDVRIQPDRITPNADGDVDVARIEYRLSRSAYVSIYFEDEAGKGYYFRRDGRRSRSAGRPYSVDFGGVVDVEGEVYGEALVKARVLGDGSYTFVVEATDDRGHAERVQLPFTVADADTTLPELRGFTVSDPVFSPNRDGVQDRVAINYYLTKPATVLVYLEDGEGDKYPVAERQGALTPVKPGEVGSHTYDYEGGVDQGAQPPPDGTYTVVALAEDRVGQKIELTRTLTVSEGGVPRATVLNLDIEYSSSIVPVGGTLCVTATVENYGDTPIRTTGPAPGTAYTTEQNFNSLGWHQSSGAWRFGLDFDGNPAYPYPFRWALGRPEELERKVIHGTEFYYLMPGKRAQITGCIEILSAPPRNPTIFYGGLVHEDVWVVNDQIDPLWITFDEPAAGSWNKRSP